MLTSSHLETEELGKRLALSFKQGDLIALHGDLGAGKTTFAKGLIAGLTGVKKEVVTSPTFTYLNIYEGRVEVYHFDLYRLKNHVEFIQMGFLDYFGEGICIIEWPERITSLLPAHTKHITLNHLEEGRRKIDVQ